MRAQLKRLKRSVEAASSERRRLADLYQGGLLELAEVQSRAKEIDNRRDTLEQQYRALMEQRSELAQQNRLRHRIVDFAQRVRESLNELSFEQRQKLIRLTLEEVRVAGFELMRQRTSCLLSAPAQNTCRTIELALPSTEASLRSDA